MAHFALPEFRDASYITTLLELATMGNRPHILHFLRSEGFKMGKFDTQGHEKYTDKAMALAIKEDFGLCLHELLLMDHKEPRDEDTWTRLEMAVKRGSILSVKVLICHMPHPLMGDDKSQDILLCALENHDLGMISVLLDSGWPTGLLSSKISPLHWAIVNDKSDIVELLLNKKADTNFINTNNRQLPLEAAVDCGSETIVELLISYDANPFVLNNAFRSPISQAIDKNKTNLVAAMLGRLKGGPDRKEEFKLFAMDPIPPFGETTLLLMAIERRNADIVRMFLDAGADPNAVCDVIDSPLNTAIRMGALNLIEILLEKGADATLNTQATGGPFHALSYCCGAGVAKIGSLKRKRGISDLGRIEGSPLPTGIEIEATAVPGTQVREKGCPFAKIANLLRSKAEVNIFDSTGTTPLIRAILCNNMSYAALLVKFKANPNQRDVVGMTAAHYAAFWGSGRLMKKLIKAELDLRLPDRLNRNPLYWAALGATCDNQYESSTRKFDAIFDVLPDPLQRYHSEAALTAVLKAGSRELFQKIIRIDAIDLNVPDRHGWTALDIASASSTLKEEADILRQMKATNSCEMQKPTKLSRYDLISNIEVSPVHCETQACVAGTIHQTPANSVYTVRADHCIPRNTICYFEVEVLELANDGAIAIGLCTESSKLTEYVGMQRGTLGYHSNDGIIGAENKEQIIAPQYRQGSTVGVAVNTIDQKAFFVYNCNWESPRLDIDGQVYLAISFSGQSKKLSKVQVNFGATHGGGPFKYCPSDDWLKVPTTESPQERSSPPVLDDPTSTIAGGLTELKTQSPSSDDEIPTQRLEEPPAVLSTVNQSVQPPINPVSPTLIFDNPSGDPSRSPSPNLSINLSVSPFVNLFVNPSVAPPVDPSVTLSANPPAYPPKSPTPTPPNNTITTDITQPPPEAVPAP
ncbi:ankyrin repeat-containing domain protein [Xylaria telfairii]|nr:ankyrin repeat-containing domain protein [Xylaria telfairii]